MTGAELVRGRCHIVLGCISNDKKQSLNHIVNEGSCPPEGGGAGEAQIDVLWVIELGKILK